MRAYSDTQSSRCIFTKEELDEKEKKAQQAEQYHVGTLAQGSEKWILRIENLPKQGM